MRVALAAAALIAGCSTEELAAVSEGLARGLAEASYDAQYFGQRPVYSGPYYSPYGFSGYAGWPTYFSYGDYVGYRRCRRTGAFYACDSDGDGYIDMYGDLSDGSFNSSSLRINGRGEAFTWGADCNCWERNRAYDGPRKRYSEEYRW